MAIVGCGGTQLGVAVNDAGADSTSPTAIDPCVAAQSFELMPLARFEATDTTKSVSNDAGTQLAGTYTTFVSFDQTGQIIDDSNHAVVTSGCTTGWQPLLGSDPGGKPPVARCGSDVQALHLFANGGQDGGTGNGAELTNWGLNLGIDLRQNCNCDSTQGVPAACGQRDHPEKGCQTYCSARGAYCEFDATAWTGISFWALLGPLSTESTALVTVLDPQTAGQSGGNATIDQLDKLDAGQQEVLRASAYPFNELVCGNPPCLAAPDGGTVDAGNDCTSNSSPLCLCDPYGKGVGLVNHWEFYAIPFADLRQKGYGRPESAIDLAHILGFKMSLGKGAWDVWIDDVSFYRPKNP